MASKERIARKKQVVRDYIIETALEIVRAEGMEGISMRKIADKIEYTAPVIYCHFKNKEALLLALVRRGYQHLNRLVEVSLNTSASPFERLELIMNCYLDFATENREFYILMFRVSTAYPKALTELPEATYFEKLLKIEIINYCKELTGLHDINREQYYFFLISLAHGMVSVNYASNRFDKVELTQNFKSNLRAFFMM